MISARSKVLASMLLEKKAFAPGSAMGAPADPAAGGAPMAGPPPMDPAVVGGQPPMDPAAQGQDMGGQDPMAMPISMLTVGDLVGLVGEVVTQAMGGGAPESGAPEAAAPAVPEGAGAEGDSLADDDVVGRLDQILELLSAVTGASAGAPAAAAPMGPDAGAAPMGGAPKMASTKVGGSIADMILDKVSDL